MDLFTGSVYRGEGRRSLYRNLDFIPVLVPAGTVIPMAADYTNSCIENPGELEVLVVHGADGSFSLYEDDCSETTDMDPVITKFEYKIGETSIFTMEREEDTRGVIPEERIYRVMIRGVGEEAAYHVICMGDTGAGMQEIQTDISYDRELCELSVRVTEKELKRFTIQLSGMTDKLTQPDPLVKIRKILQNAQISYDIKENILRVLEKESDNSRIFASLHELRLTNVLFGTILEALTSNH